MRKITSDAVRAFRRGLKFNRDNTSVERSPLGHAVVLKLHGNAIARYTPSTDGLNKFEICNGGWSSNTTKERLNGLPGVSIHQKDWVWYLNGKEWNGAWTTINL